MVALYAITARLEGVRFCFVSKILFLDRRNEEREKIRLQYHLEGEVRGN